jgi:PAS domain S-box-containing protein
MLSFALDDGLRAFFPDRPPAMYFCRPDGDTPLYRLLCRPAKDVIVEPTRRRLLDFVPVCSVQMLFLSACLCGVWFLGATPALGLDPSVANTQYGLSSWLADDGLPQNTVIDMAQTPDGYVWFATEEGLARFDGVRFTNFISHQTVSTLLVSRDGALWIGSDGGLARYKDGRMTHYPNKDSLGSEGILSMAESPDGGLWMATRSRLIRYDGGQFRTYTLTDGSAAGWIWTTSVTRDGALWYGTNGEGLKRFDGGFVKTYTTRDGLADNIVLSLQLDGVGDLWIGTNNGLSRMHDGKITTFPKAGAFSNWSVKIIRQDRDGNVWIGTEGGLLRYSGGTFTSFGARHRLSDAVVLSLLEDREGSLWVGTSGAGVNQLRTGKFSTLGQSEGVNADLVWCVRESSDGSLLIGTDHGFSHWKDGVMTTLTVRDGLSAGGVRAVAEDHTGGIWLGTNDGVNLYKNGKVTAFGIADGLPAHTVRMVTEDRQGNIWIGTRGGGLARYRDGIFKVFNEASGLPGNVIASMDEDSDGSLWIGTNAGLSVLKNGVFRNYSMRDGLSSNAVRVTYHDRQGGHWVGTYRGGLNRIKNGRITPILVKDGLFDEVVFAIVEDRHGYLWMTCNRGVFRVSLRELNDFADGRIQRVHSTSFDATDGMKATECNGGSPGAWEGKNGRLYFATVKGVAVIESSHITSNTLPPPVWIEDVLLDGKRADTLNSVLTIGPGRHALEVHYTALSFMAPKKVAFRYRLKGFSDDWTEAGNRRTAFYTNLPPGTYRFEVMGSNNDGLWNGAGNPLQLQVRAAFFQTLSFKIACVLCLLLAARAAFEIRLRLHQERERLLVTRVAEQTALLSAGKENAEAVAEANTLLRLENERILNSIADGVVAVDPGGSITVANPAAAKMLGWRPEELVGRPAHQTLHHSALSGPYSREDCPLHKTVVDGVTRQGSNEVFWRRDGTSFPADYLAAPIVDSRGGVTGVAVTFRDITEQREMERLKDEFISTVSHELRTPLTSIRGALGLLGSGLLGPIAEKGQRMLQIAVSNTDRLVRLINDILDLERMESGTIELRLGTVDTNAVMVQALEGLQSMADEAAVQLVLLPAAATLRGDSDRIVQTLTNLLGNAIKFSPPGTAITLSGTAGERDFVFCVADQGRGVPEQKLQTIFERFSQVDASDSRDKGGSGLGLAISRSIVTAHGGRIWAEANEPSGSRFRFTIPLAVPSGIDAAAINTQTSRTILVCQRDSSPGIVEVLEHQGFRVVRAASPDDVPALAARITPDAIILDLAGDSSSRQIVEALKATAETRQVPIVVAAGTFPESYESYAAALVDWVGEPLESTDLIHALDLACRAPSILVVEDDVDLARVLIAALESHGIRTFHAVTGGDAIDLCRQHPPSLIVLDLILPDIDGFAVVGSLRESAHLAGIPLLVYSALDVGSADQSRLRLGPTEFLTKSRCSPAEFDRHVVRLLETVTHKATERSHAA